MHMICRPPLDQYKQSMTKAILLHSNLVSGMFGVALTIGFCKSLRGQNMFPVPSDQPKPPELPERLPLVLGTLLSPYPSNSVSKT